MTGVPGLAHCCSSTGCTPPPPHYQGMKQALAPETSTSCCMNMLRIITSAAIELKVNGPVPQQQFCKINVYLGSISKLHLVYMCNITSQYVCCMYTQSVIIFISEVGCRV